MACSHSEWEQDQQMSKSLETQGMMLVKSETQNPVSFEICVCIYMCCCFVLYWINGETKQKSNNLYLPST